MRNELFTIGPLTVYGYGFMIAVGVIAAWIITNRRAEKQKLGPCFFISDLVPAGRTVLCKNFILDHGMEKYCTGSTLYSGYDFRWICCIWRYYRRDSGRLSVLLYQKDRFLEIF